MKRDRDRTGMETEIKPEMETGTGIGKLTEAEVVYK